MLMIRQSLDCLFRRILRYSRLRMTQITQKELHNVSSYREKINADKTQQLSHHDLSDAVLQCVKSSNVHFAVKKTPLSVYITLRKKFLYRDSKKVSASKAFTESNALKVELSQSYQKCEDLVQENLELKNLNLVEKKDDETNNLETLLHDQENKLDKAKVELSEALRKFTDEVKENEEKVGNVS